MKASRCLTACTARLFTALTASVLLVQCAMPSKEAWSYIQTNGLLPYLNHRPSPPFRTGSNSYQRYAGSSLYPQRRYTPSNNYWSPTAPVSPRYSAVSPRPTPNNYFSSPNSSADNYRPRYIPRQRPESRPEPKIRVDEPAVEPRVTHTPPPVSPTPKSSTSPAPAASPGADLPYGSPVPGRSNMVNSPFAGKTQLVDVSGMSAGQTVKCPYTGKLFKVPPTQQASNKTEPHKESKVEAPQLSDEPKPADKKP